MTSLFTRKQRGGEDLRLAGRLFYTLILRSIGERLEAEERIDVPTNETADLRVDVRLIAATDRDLEKSHLLRGAGSSAGPCR